MSRTVVLEEVRGTGRIFYDNGELWLAGVDYAIVIRQRMHETRSHSGTNEVPGMKSVDGRLFASVSVTSHVGREVILGLEDGRRWPCYIQSGDGHLLSRGDLS